VAVAENASQADTRSVCVIRMQQQANIASNTESHAGVSAVAELIAALGVIYRPVPETRSERA